jgi:hypothetical protein
MKTTKVVNLYAGPGTGKSTTAAALFAELKYRGVNCEYVQEVAKWATWESRGQRFFSDQMRITAEQCYLQNILKGQVDIIITDSPVFVGSIYHDQSYPISALRACMVQTYEQYDNLDVFLVRDPSRGYNSSGRSQTEAEAIQKDKEMLMVMDTVLPFYEKVNFSRTAPMEIIDKMIERRWHVTVPSILNYVEPSSP